MAGPEFDPQQMRSYGDAAQKASASTTNINKDLKGAAQSLKGLGSLYGGEFADAMVKASSGVKDIVAGILSFNPLNWAASVKGITDGIFKLAEAADKVDGYMADVNRSMYDISAHMGELGVNSEEVRDIASDLAPKYGMFAGEIDKVVKGVADIGVSSEHVRDVTDDILNLTLIWSDMTPEKQLNLMSGYMKEFGLNSKEAHNVVKNLVLDANILKESITELDVDQFIDQIHSVAMNTRSWNVDLYQAQSFVEGLALSFGDTAESMTRAADIAPKLMGYGRGDLPMQAYMMQQAGIGDDDVFKQIGTFTIDAEKRAEAQLNTFETMVENISGEKLETISDPERLAGMLQIGAQGGVLPGFTEAEIKELVEGGGAGMGDVFDKIREQLTASAKKEEERAEAAKKLPQHIESIKDDVTKLSTRVMIDIEVATRESAFYLKEMVTGGSGVEGRQQGAEEFVLERMQMFGKDYTEGIIGGGMETDLLKRELAASFGLSKDQTSEVLEKIEADAAREFSKVGGIVEAGFITTPEDKLRDIITQQGPTTVDPFAAQMLQPGMQEALRGASTATQVTDVEGNLIRAEVEIKLSGTSDVTTTINTNR